MNLLCHFFSAEGLVVIVQGISKVAFAKHHPYDFLGVCYADAFKLFAEAVSDENNKGDFEFVLWVKLS